jgi:hypothetical protein
MKTINHTFGQLCSFNFFFFFSFSFFVCLFFQIAKAKLFGRPFSSKLECDERPAILKDISCKWEELVVNTSWFARRKPTHAESSTGT